MSRLASRVSALAAGSVLLVGLGVGPPSAQAKGGAPSKPAAPAVDPARARAEGGEKALAWLEENLDRVPESQGTPRRPFTVAGVIHA